MTSSKIFGGLTLIELEETEFELGHGVLIRQAYAHLSAHFMMAYSPPNENLKLKIHGDWRATKGGIAFDILTEIEISEIAEFKDTLSQEELLWLITCLIRLGGYPFVMLSAISDMSYNSVKESDKNPTIYPFETRNRIFSLKEGAKPYLTKENLEWLKQNWIKAARLIHDNPKFYGALKALDDSSIQGNPSSSLLTIWGAIEQLFSPNTGELKYRVSTNLASFLKPRGEERLKLFKEISKLYNERSTAAHTAKKITYEPVVSSFLHLRNAVIKIIEAGELPTQKDLEELTFL